MMWVHLRVYVDSIKFCIRNSAARIVKMALSDTKVRSAKSEDKVYKLTDGNGLFLLVHSNGSKYWRFCYRFGGKEKMLVFGVISYFYRLLIMI